MHDHPREHEKQACYYFNYCTRDGVDLFIRPVYKQVVVHTLNHFIEHKGLVIYAWCLMSNQLQMFASIKKGFDFAAMESELREFTTAKIHEALETEPESRRQWMMEHFHTSEGLLGLMKKFAVWDPLHLPLQLDFRKCENLVEQFESIHDNPVRERIVDIAVDYKYSSARDYSGMPGLVHITKLPMVEQHLAAAENINGSLIVKYIRN
jgi:hypothetical protein